MKQALKDKLCELFHEADEEFPDKSTEFILEISAQWARTRNIKPDCDSGDIAESIE